MPLKTRGEEVEANATSIQVSDEWEGAWGAINPTAHSVTTLRLITATEMVDYPYRLLGKRALVEADRDTFTVEVAGETVKIPGLGLRKLADAVSNEMLEIVREQGELGPGERHPGSIYIFSVKLKEDDR